MQSSVINNRKSFGRNSQFFSPDNRRNLNELGLEEEDPSPNQSFHKKKVSISMSQATELSDRNGRYSVFRRDSEQALALDQKKQAKTEKTGKLKK